MDNQKPNAIMYGLWDLTERESETNATTARTKLKISNEKETLRK